MLKAKFTIKLPVFKNEIKEGKVEALESSMYMQNFFWWWKNICGENLFKCNKGHRMLKDPEGSDESRRLLGLHPLRLRHRVRGFRFHNCNRICDRLRAELGDTRGRSHWWVEGPSPRGSALSLCPTEYRWAQFGFELVESPNGSAHLEVRHR